MNRPTEYIAIKRLLGRKRDNGEIHGNEVTGIIHAACHGAYNDLDVIEKHYLNKNKRLLMQKKNIGDEGALELLAAIGDWMNNGKEMENDIAD